MRRRRFGTALVVVVIAAVLVSTLPAPCAAQEPPVRIEGRVLWIAAQTMVVAPFANGVAIRIDLTYVHQDEYMGLVTNDPVAVTGTVSAARDRVIGASIERLAS